MKKATLRKDWYTSVWKAWQTDKVKVEKEYGTHPFGGGCTIDWLQPHPEIMLTHPFYKKYIEVPKFQIFVTRKPCQKKGFQNYSISNNDLLTLPKKLNLIYVENVLEHFSYNDVANLLINWHDRLLIGGSLQIVTPNLKVLANKYLNKQLEYHNFLQQLYGTQQTSEDFNAFVFDETALKVIMEEIGFTQIRIESTKLVLKGFGRKEQEF